MKESAIPTPYDWAGGLESFNKLMTNFYDKVLKDEVLYPLFKNMSPDHQRHVANFLSEVFKGPKFYSAQHGDQAIRHMVGKHIGKKITEAQRKRWVELLMLSADELDLPNDPEFRSTFVGHIEWGTRIALINSQLSENPMTSQNVIPTWGWGEVNGPYGSVPSLFDKTKDDQL